MIFYKYQGAGNDFLIADNRDGKIFLSAEEITQLCDRRYGIGANGLMLLERGDNDYDFRMTYFNSDGSGGMMCGNGGRCIVAFAKHRKVRHKHKGYAFIAADGPHVAYILSSEGKKTIVKLKMQDVEELIPYPLLGGTFLDTGTRHLVCEVNNLASYDVASNGARLRHRQEFAPIGANVNFIEKFDDSLHVRTFEKGVEAETFACGTGITAAAIVAHHNKDEIGQSIHQPIQALRDSLVVDFTPTKNGAEDVWLTGPATYICKIIL